MPTGIPAPSVSCGTLWALETLEPRVLLSGGVQAQYLAAHDPGAPISAPVEYLLQLDREAGLPPLQLAAITNLLSNGTFEGGNLNGWSAGSATASQLDAHGGTWSARITTNSMRVTVPTVVGTTYKFTGWFHIASETGTDWGGLRAEAFATTSPSWTTLAHSGYLTTGSQGSNWFKISISFTAQFASTPIDVGYSGGAGRTMVTYADDLMVFVKPATNSPPVITAGLTPTDVTGVPQDQQYAITGDDPDGAIKRVEWDFGDGSRALDLSGTRRVGLPGSYTATVKLTDDEGAMVQQTVNWTASGTGFPVLAVTSPTGGVSTPLTVSTATLAMTGTAGGTGVTISSVKVSSDRGVLMAATGTSTWSASVPLLPGLNRLTVQAAGTNGKMSTVERLVRYVPAGALGISNVVSAASVERWQPLEVTFGIDNSAATDLQFPYDAAPAPGLEWVDGITVNALFSKDNWQTVYSRPAFLNQPYQRAQKNSQEWLYPSGQAVWTARFAPPAEGSWQYFIEVTEARGTAQSAVRSFTATAAVSPRNHGPIIVSTQDSRYFQYADGTPFLGNGINIGFSDTLYSYDAVNQFNQMGLDNEQLLRWWISGDIWASAWQSWNSSTIGYNGYIPANGLSMDRAYSDGLASMELTAGSPTNPGNPVMFQGWMSGHAATVSGKTYKVRVRWRTEGITGPAAAGAYGITLKLTNWPGVNSTTGQPNTTVTGAPAIIPNENGDTPWHVSEGSFVADSNYIGASGRSYLTFALENATGGSAYVDEVTCQEVLADGSLGPNVLLDPQMNSQLVFDPRNSAAIDTILAEAQSRGIAFKMVISEKNEFLLNHYAPDGLPDRNGGNFNDGAGTPSHELHEYYWRYLFARFGAYTSIQSWETVNEDDPNSTGAFRLAADLATAAKADGDPHLANLSTWSSLATAQWKASYSAPISFDDFHAYVRSTGWITSPSRDALARDSALLFSSYDQAVKAANLGKPVVWGELGIDGTTGSDNQDPLLAQDTTGIWLHKLIWARTGPGGVYPLYWYTDNIFSKNLHGVYGTWNRFMAGVPLTNGHYVDAAATSSNPAMRVFGQKDLTNATAQLWIDDSNHTWYNVVTAASIASVSGTVSVSLGKPNAVFVVTWWNTYTGQVSSTQNVTANASGTVTLTLASLVTDTAAQLRLATPAAPSGLIATAVSSTSIQLAWTDESTDEADFHVERSPNGTSGWVEIGTTGPNVKSYTDTGLTSNTPFYYRVRAHNTYGYSDYTAPANATTQQALPAELRLVMVATPTAGTTAATLPDPGLLSMLEDHPFYAELWVRSSPGGPANLSGGTLSLSYSPARADILSVEPVSANWTSGADGTIDNAAGTLAGLTRTNSSPSLGDNEWVLFARVQLSGQATVDEAAHAFGPYDLGLTLQPGAFPVTGQSLAPTVAAGDAAKMYSVIYDVDDSGRVLGGDFSIFAAAYRRYTTDPEPPYAMWADFDAGGRVLGGDLGLFSGAYRKYTYEVDFSMLPSNYRPVGWTAGASVRTSPPPAGPAGLPEWVLSAAPADVALPALTPAALPVRASAANRPTLPAPQPGWRLGLGALPAAGAAARPWRAAASAFDARPARSPLAGPVVDVLDLLGTPLLLTLGR